MHVGFIKVPIEKETDSGVRKASCFSKATLEAERQETNVIKKMDGKMILSSLDSEANCFGG